VSKGFVQKILKQKQTIGHVQPRKQGGSIGNKLSLYASCQGEFSRSIKEILILASLSIGERGNN
jgi:hypothetical protein